MSQNGIESLISSVTPTTAPHHSIALRSSRMIRRAIRYATNVQHSGSNDVVLSVAVRPRNIGANAVAAPAITVAPRPPPNRRTNAHVTRTSAAAASTTGRRSSHVWWPRPYIVAASSGTSGGWSTYPNAGWRPQTMK